MIYDGKELMDYIVKGFEYYEGEPFLIRLSGDVGKFYRGVDAEKLKFSGIASIGILTGNYLDLILGDTTKVADICRSIFFDHHGFEIIFDKPNNFPDNLVRIIQLDPSENIVADKVEAWREKLNNYSIGFIENRFRLELRDNMFLYPLSLPLSEEFDISTPVFEKGQKVRCHVVDGAVLGGEVYNTRPDGLIEHAGKVFGIGMVIATEKFDDNHQRITVEFEEINKPLLERLGFDTLHVTYVDGVMEMLPFGGRSLQVVDVPSTHYE